MLGTPELIIIVAIVVLVFGASAIPKLAKSLGQAKSEFEKGVSDGKKSAENPKVEDKKTETEEK